MSSTEILEEETQCLILEAGCPIRHELQKCAKRGRHIQQCICSSLYICLPLCIKPAVIAVITADQQDVRLVSAIRTRLSIVALDQILWLCIKEF